jgi:hypothetical protein
MKINMLKPAWTMNDAARRMSKRSKHFFIKDMNVLFYPYLKIVFSIEMGEKLSRFNSKAICLVDMYTGRYSLARNFGEYTVIEMEDDHVMPVKVDRKEAIDGAPIEISGEIMAKKRLMKIPDIIYKSDELFYKPFYIVECKNDEDQCFHMLFDAVLGEFSLLNA